MGLMLRYYLFRDVSPRDVCAARKAFYGVRVQPLKPIWPAYGSIDVHEIDNGWVVTELGNLGWEWKERRALGRFISKRLWSPGFLIFVYDGEYWGYEFYDRGEALDRFVQDEDNGAAYWFPGEDRSGNARVIVEHLPFL